MIKRKPISEEAALLMMADLCARSEQCAADIMMKLQRKGLSYAACNRIIDRLRADRYLDELRFAGAFARDKAKFQMWGRMKISYALRLKKIDSSVIREALDSIDEEEYRETIARLVKIKAEKLNPRVYEERMKIMRSLAAKGYEAGLISKAISDYVAHT